MVIVIYFNLMSFTIFQFALFNLKKKKWQQQSVLTFLNIFFLNNLANATKMDREIM